MFYGHSGSSNNISNYVKDGKFAIKDRDLPWKVAAVVRAASGLCSFARSTPFVSAVSKCMFAEGFSHERLIERINRRLIFSKSAVSSAITSRCLKRSITTRRAAKGSICKQRLKKQCEHETLRPDQKQRRKPARIQRDPP